MRIKVMQVARNRDGTIVTCGTTLGVATANWASRNRVPVEGAEYDVELDLDVVLERAKNMLPDDAAVPALFIEGDWVTLHATVEGVDDDGVAYLRLARDCLIMVETVGEISAGKAIRVTVPPSAISVTPFGGP